MRNTAPIDIHVATVSKVVSALREAFHSSYYEEQFRNLYISPDFPIRKERYPNVIVGVSISSVEDAGVGHVEQFPDSTGMMRKWNKSHFRGSINLTVSTLSTQDRDILTDALIEIIRYSRIRVSLHDFIHEMYDDQFAKTQRSGRFQLNLNHSTLSISGKSSAPAPWDTEDELVYSQQISVPFFGGSYNAQIEGSSQFVSRIDVHARYRSGESDLEDSFFVSAKEWTDRGIVSFISEISGIE